MATWLKHRVLGTGAILGALTVVALSAMVWPGAGPRQSGTLQNLQAAYNSEANVFVRYVAFADRAQEEEYFEVASLFRAAAHAEHVHLKNLAAVIRKLGAEPASTIDEPVVKTTEQNLRTSVEGKEASERDTMYPAFIEKAKAEGNEDAVRVFQYALTAEAQHSRLFSAALENLEHTGAESHLYYVCSTCGFTTEHAAKPCPGCSDPNATYVQVY